MKARELLGIASALIVGALASSVGGLWHPYVTVNVKNMSPKAVTTPMPRKVIDRSGLSFC